MTVDERGREFLENESKKMEAKSFLDALYSLNGRSGNDSMISQMRNIVKDEGFNQEKNQEIVRKLLLENIHHINKIVSLFDFLKHYKKTDARVKHDLNNIAAAVGGFLSFYLDAAQKDDELDIDGLDEMVATWDRYLVAAEDTLLRIISEDKILPEHNAGLNIETVSGAINYFSGTEITNIRSFSKEKNSAYKEINNKRINFISAADWDKLTLELGDRQITGNNGLVGNFILNALRNSLKDRVEADNIRLSAKVQGDWFVVRVEDDGKGIMAKFLQKDYREKDEVTGEEKNIYIFHEGASGTGSTGIGLADFDNRLASVGGELYVISKPKYVEQKDLVRFQYGADAEKLKTVEFNEGLEHGTVFEIRLPITKK